MAERISKKIESTAVRFKRFLKTDIWRMSIRDLAWPQSVVIRSLRVVLLTIRGLAEERWQITASALTYYTALSAVPALAMFFGIAKGFGAERAFRSFIINQFYGQETMLQQVLEFSQTLLENVKGGLIAGIGFVILFWSIFRILSHTENAFNRIWGVGHGRALSRRVTDYLALILIGPFFLVISSATTLFISRNVQAFIDKYSLLATISPVIHLVLNLLPFAVMWIVLTFIYAFIPNTKIRITSALISGIVAGTIFQIFQSIYIWFQVSITSYNAVYGSFAALPLFLMWMYFSWLIVLFGAQLCSAHQNGDIQEYNLFQRRLSHSYRIKVCLYIVQMLIEAFSAGRKPGVDEIAHRLGVSRPLVNQMLTQMADAGLISAIALDGEAEAVYQPAQDPDYLTVKSVMDALDRLGQNELTINPHPAWTRIDEALQALDGAIEISPANILLKKL